ncbi:ABC transporter permease subunit [Devosia sp. 2618]|uniref:amino acid ABC transporter permease n=1 Tax=Devosia sp. 2618 TaxID=3156454 RepID=UPI003398FB0F
MADKTITGLLYSPRFRALVFQGLVLAALAFLIGSAVQTVSANLSRLGISSGFDFLSREGHFGIGQALIEHSDSSTYFDAFKVALLNTLLVAGLAIVTATILGFVIGLMRVSKNPLFALLGKVFVEFNRNIPLLLHLLFWYYVTLTMLPVVRESLVLGDVVLNRRGLYLPRPSLDASANGVVLGLVAMLFAVGVGAFIAWFRRGNASRVPGRVLLSVTAVSIVVGFWVGMSQLTWETPALSGLTYRGGLRMLPELVALWFCLTLYQSAFIAEIVRSGIQSVEKVQYEAAEALTFTSGKMYRYVVIPQAARVILPPYTGSVLNIIKDTSLGAAIGYPELMQVFWSTVLVQTGQGIEVVVITLGTYLTISLVFALLINLYSRRFAIPGR